MSKKLLLSIVAITVVGIAGTVPGIASAQSSGREAGLGNTQEVNRAELPVAADPFQQSQKIKANLEVWPERMARRLAEANQRVTELDLKEIKAHRMLVQEFGTILDDIDEEAAAIQDAFSKVTTDLKLYQEALVQAPASFRAIAVAFETKATASDDITLKENYADFAAVSRSMANRYEARSKSLVTTERDIQDKIIFVAKSRVFISDVKQFLSTIPANEAGIEVERFVKRLNLYIKTFQDSVRMLKNLSEKLDTESSSPGSPQPNNRAVPKSNPQASRPLSAEEYRSSLAALKRNH